MFFRRWCSSYINRYDRDYDWFDLIVWFTTCTGEDWAWRQLCWLRELSHRVQTLSIHQLSQQWTSTAKIHVNKPQYCLLRFPATFQAVYFIQDGRGSLGVTVQMESMNQSKLHGRNRRSGPFFQVWIQLLWKSSSNQWWRVQFGLDRQMGPSPWLDSPKDPSIWMSCCRQVGDAYFNLFSMEAKAVVTGRNYVFVLLYRV